MVMARSDALKRTTLGFDYWLIVEMPAARERLGYDLDMGRGSGYELANIDKQSSVRGRLSTKPDDHDELYCDWSESHDYDPRWDYDKELRPDWQQHPLVQAAQQRLRSITGRGGRVFATDLQSRNAVGMYVFGTGAQEPGILVDPYQHERLTKTPDEAHQQMMHTIDHEYRHARQEEMADGQPDFDEGDAEDWRF
jgi:hypothetical protein